MQGYVRQARGQCETLPSPQASNPANSPWIALFLVRIPKFLARLALPLASDNFGLVVITFLSVRGLASGCSWKRGVSRTSFHCKLLLTNSSLLPFGTTIQLFLLWCFLRQWQLPTHLIDDLDNLVNPFQTKMRLSKEHRGAFIVILHLHCPSALTKQQPKTECNFDASPAICNLDLTEQSHRRLELFHVEMNTIRKI
jgi:hypothetical protein